MRDEISNWIKSELKTISFKDWLQPLFKNYKRNASTQKSGRNIAAFTILAVISLSLYSPNLSADSLQYPIDSWESLARSGDPESQFKLGEMYSEGLGVPQSDEKAVAWLSKAAENGHLQATYALGVFYHLGRGVKSDNTRAVEYFRIAATL